MKQKLLANPGATTDRRQQTLRRGSGEIRFVNNDREGSQEGVTEKTGEEDWSEKFV